MWESKMEENELMAILYVGFWIASYERSSKNYVYRILGCICRLWKHVHFINKRKHKYRQRYVDLQILSEGCHFEVFIMIQYDNRALQICEVLVDVLKCNIHPCTAIPFRLCCSKKHCKSLFIIPASSLSDCSRKSFQPSCTFWKILGLIN